MESMKGRLGKKAILVPRSTADAGAGCPKCPGLPTGCNAALDA
jgi:hypothetical protein